MAAFNFPNSPNTNDVHTENGVSFKWDGTVWKRVSGTGAQGATGSTGSQGAAGAQGDNASLDISTGAPSSPDAGDLWFDSDSGVLAAYYNDGNSSQWVEVSTGPIGAQGAQGNTGAGGATGAQGATGATGSQGDDGSTGAQGATGAGGSTGPSGATGAQGATGATGAQGDDGSTGAQGATGSGGATGAQGATGSGGSTGAQGAEGNFGGATFYYTFEANTTDANPGAGDLRLDNSTQNAATGIYICDTDEDGTDIASYLQTIDDSTSTIKGHVKITNKLDSSQFLLFTISSLTDNTGYFDITVSPVDSSATSPFSANEDILITFARTGDKGDTGAQGAAGSSGSAGAQGATGATGAQGATGPTGAQGATGSGGSTGPSGATGAQGAQGAAGSATISSNADNRVITGGSGTNLNGESNLTFNGSLLNVFGRISCDVNSDIDMSNSADGQLVIGGDGYTSAIALNDQGMQIYHNSGSRAIIFGTNETERLRIDSSGNVDIATGQLTISNDIKSSDDDFYIYSYKGGSDGQVRSGIQYDGNSQRLRFFTGTNERLRINSSGNFSIGDDSNFTPGAKVEIRDTIGGGGGTGLILNDIGSSGAAEGLHIEWRSGSDKQADQCRIGQSANATGSGSNFFIATNSADSGSSTTRLTITSGGNVKIASGVIENSNTISSNYTVSSNYNAMSAGPMSIANGVSVTVPSGSAWTIV